MAELSLVRLGDVADFLTGFPFKSANYIEDSSGVRLLRGDNIVQGALRWDGVKRWPTELASQHEMYRLLPGDVVLAMDRPWIEAGLKYAALSDDDCPSLLVQRVTRLRRTDYITSRYLRYVIGGIDFTQYVLAVQTGTAVPHISGGQIKAFEFLLPPVPAQEAIASVLGVLDDKIELNRRMNETLEAMARAIFKDWFVDFGPTRAKMAIRGEAPSPRQTRGEAPQTETTARAPYLAPEIWSLFPDRLDDDGKPEGWQSQSVEALYDVSIGRTPPRKEQQHFVANGRGRKWLSIRDMANLQTFAFDTSEELTDEAVARFRVPIVPAGTALLSFKLTVGRVAIAAEPMCTNEAIANLIPKPKCALGPCFTYLFLAAYDYSQVGSTSSIATAFNSDSVRRMKVNSHNARLAIEFESLVAPIFDKIRSNGRESRTLAATRDLLLPKLMSGEVRVRDAEKLVEAAT